MPKLPVLTARKLLKILIRAGFYEHHQSGSHIQMKHSDGRRTTVPFHNQEIRRGTLRAIINDIEMTVDEFIILMGKKK